MKESRSQNNMQNKQTKDHRTKPEIRDNIDSRKNEEQDNKGDDETHNKKETKKHHLKEKD